MSRLVSARSRPRISRATLIARKQAEKATQLKRYTPSKVEAVVVDFGRGFLSGPNGFYPLVGSVYGGGGFSAGAGYRKY